MPVVVLLTNRIKRNFGRKATSHPRAMEPGYLQIDLDTIPGLYNHKHHLRTLIIEKKEWDCLYLIPLNSLTSGSLPRIQRISIAR